jgi:hypothetical protein
MAEQALIDASLDPVRDVAPTGIGRPGIAFRVHELGIPGDFV